MRNAVRRSIRVACPLDIDLGRARVLRMRSPAVPAAASAMMKNRCPVRVSRRAQATRKARTAQQARGGRAAPRRRKSGGAGGSSFDGAWVVNRVGITCSGSSRNAVVVTSGRIIGQGVSGTVSPNGQVSGDSTIQAASPPPASADFPAAAAPERSGNPMDAAADGRHRSNNCENFVGLRAAVIIGTSPLWKTEFKVRSAPARPPCCSVAA